MKPIILVFTGAFLSFGQCTEIPLVPLGSINGHAAYGDASSSNGLVSWLSLYQCNVAYQALLPAVNFWVNSMPQDGFGNPMWYGYDYATIANPPVGQTSMAIVSGMAGAVIQAGLNWQAFSGDSSMLNNAIDFVSFVLANGLSGSGASWPSVPYSGSHNVTYPYDGWEPPQNPVLGTVEPDKMAYMGYWLVKLYEQTSTTVWLTQATHYADVLVDKQITGDSTHSPWPFRVNSLTGASISNYTGNAYDACGLFSELIAINQHGAHSVADYAAARESAITWLKTYPVATNYWDNCCEDEPGSITPGTNIAAPVALYAALYFLQHNSEDSSFLGIAEGIVSYVTANFGVTDLGGAVTIKEQAEYNTVTTGSTALYAWDNALLSTLTEGSTSASYQAVALHSFNWVSYMVTATSGGLSGQADAVPSAPQLFFRASNVNMLQFMIGAVLTLPSLGSATTSVSLPATPPSLLPLSPNTRIVGVLTDNP